MVRRVSGRRCDPAAVCMRQSVQRMVISHAEAVQWQAAEVGGCDALGHQMHYVLGLSRGDVD